MLIIIKELPCYCTHFLQSGENNYFLKCLYFCIYPNLQLHLYIGLIILVLALDVSGPGALTLLALLTSMIIICIMAARLKSVGIPLRLCSNTSTKSPLRVSETLTSLGFDILPHEIFTPIPAVKQYLQQNSLRPYLIVDPG